MKKKSKKESEFVRTVTGRKIPAPPRIRLDSNRKCANDLKKLNVWLVEQAIEEALARNDDFNRCWIFNENPKNLPDGVKTTLNVYLFGEEYPRLEVLGE